MKSYFGSCLAICLLLGSAGTLAAQSAPNGVMAPPKVLVIYREFVKPGKSGAPHQRTESAFVNAMTAAKWPTHYLAMDSMSGSPRSLFFTGYDSFAAWENDNLAGMKNATLSAALDRASVADGELLSASDGGAFVYSESMSLRAGVNIAQYRYFEISRFVVKPGHDKEWEDLVKMYVDGFTKSSSTVLWATYSSMYGADNGGVYLVLTPLKSLAEADREAADNKKFAEQMGEDGMKKLAELTASCVKSSATNLFSFSPKMSYPPDEWVKSDPGFWKPKPAAAPAAKKPEAKPAQ
jgi:hypothetical protein